MGSELRCLRAERKVKSLSKATCTDGDQAIDGADFDLVEYEYILTVVRIRNEPDLALIYPMMIIASLGRWTEP